MINFIETLFGVAAAVLLGAVIARWRERSPLARRLALFGGASLLLAILFELYVRYAA